MMTNYDTLRKIDSRELEPGEFTDVELSPGVPEILDAELSLAGPRANIEQLGIGFDAELRGVVRLAPGSEDEGDGNEVFIFDRGLNPKRGVISNNNSGDNQKILSPKNRYILITNTCLSEIANLKVDESGRVAEEGWKGVKAGSKITLGRGNENFGGSLGPGVSSGHVGIEFMDDGSICVTDLISTNGTSLIKPNLNSRKEDVGQAEGEQTYSREFRLGEVNLGLLGAVKIDGKDLGYVLNTESSDGKSRRMVVYKSSSDGNWRATQGIDEEGRFMKGSERARVVNHYTQETRLHPELRGLVEDFDMDDSIPLIDPTSVPKMMSMEAAMIAEQDFADVTRLTQLPDKRLVKALHGLRAGGYKISDFKREFGMGPEIPDSAVEARLLERIDEVNKALEKSKIVPDFSRPNIITTERHPILGFIYKSVFSVDVDGRKYEWTMANTENGEKVWIDGIRFADAQVSAYGTDEEVLDSAFLTSKPIEYKSETDGIPKSLRLDTSRDLYDDITPFLALLGPIQKFKNLGRVVKKAI